MQDLQSLIRPICRRAFTTYGIGFHDQQDIAQEVAMRILYRTNQKERLERFENYVRKTAKWEVRKLCLSILRARAFDLSIKEMAKSFLNRR